MNERFFKKLETFCNENLKDSSHGYAHFLTVYKHCVEALKLYPHPITDTERQAVLYAALLHDVDDRKLFNTVNYANARKLLDDEEVSNDTVDLILKMIRLVSCSVNGNEISPDDSEFVYYPRFADRLEATGMEGVRRCLLFGQEKQRVLYDETVDAVHNMQELQRLAPPERFDLYCKGKPSSQTTMGHFLDKLVHINTSGTNNAYFLATAEQYRQQLIQFLFQFWNSSMDERAQTVKRILSDFLLALTTAYKSTQEIQYGLISHAQIEQRNKLDLETNQLKLVAVKDDVEPYETSFLSIPIEIDAASILLDGTASFTYKFRIPSNNFQSASFVAQTILQQNCWPTEIWVEVLDNHWSMKMAKPFDRTFMLVDNVNKYAIQQDLDWFVGITVKVVDSAKPASLKLHLIVDDQFSSSTDDDEESSNNKSTRDADSTYSMFSRQVIVFFVVFMVVGALLCVLLQKFLTQRTNNNNTGNNGQYSRVPANK